MSHYADLDQPLSVYWTFALLSTWVADLVLLAPSPFLSAVSPILSVVIVHLQLLHSCLHMLLPQLSIWHKLHKRCHPFHLLDAANHAATSSPLETNLSSFMGHQTTLPQIVHRNGLIIYRLRSLPHTLFFRRKLMSSRFNNVRPNREQQEDPSFSSRHCGWRCGKYSKMLQQICQSIP